jgi:hypothetical protein
MKALFLSFALLVCVFFSMSAFTISKHRSHKTTVKTVPSWPITGTHAGYAYTIRGNGDIPSSISFNTSNGAWGPFTFSAQGLGGWVASPSSPVSPSITAVEMFVYTNQPGYVITWHPDL